MSAKDTTILIKHGVKVIYVSLDRLCEVEKEALFAYLKNGEYEKAGEFMNKMEQSSEIITDHTKATTSRSIFEPPTLRDHPPQHVEQTSLGQIGDQTFEDEQGIETVYERAKKGDEKSLRMIGAWANQGDKRAKIFLIEISKTPEQPRERIIIL